MSGIEITNWTARFALLCYTTVLCGNLAASCCQRWPSLARWLWTIGCVWMLAHITSAFHFIHHWRHAEAVEHTARQTAEQIGGSFGGGIYFNYAFAAIWLGDVLWSWIAKESYRNRSWAAAGPIHAYLFFMAFNGTVVFEEGPTRWAGVLFVLLLIALGMRALFSRNAAAPSCGKEHETI